ncbi:hypothetical protein T11_9967 [Trichinella zimbabwensis]|uniref:Uncharacterized protein n=1 Tax=Trichinella zimbabwensis TaxID=268475 RepID=A0A0V1H555_9BILA|nr:hypothetical protein T11_9967 [Trichinella zimbabwensis]
MSAFRIRYSTGLRKNSLPPANDVEALFQAPFSSYIRLGFVKIAFHRLTTSKHCFRPRSVLATDKRLARPLKRITQSFLSSPSYSTGLRKNSLPPANDVEALFQAPFSSCD